MPIHDWTRVDAGLYHAFHLMWIDSLSEALNDGALPSEYYALPEQKTAGVEPDVLTLNLKAATEEESSGGVALAIAPPETYLVTSIEEDLYARRANHIAIHHRHGNVVAVIELVSPGNKSSKAAIAAFVKKSAEFIQQGIHLLVIDPFPPGKRDPLGIHKLIWDEFREEAFNFPTGKLRILASYFAGPPWTAYVEPLAVGEPIPRMPLFLSQEIYVWAPLENSYQAAWNKFPKAVKGLLG